MRNLARTIVIALAMLAGTGVAHADELTDQCARVTDLRFLPAFCHTEEAVTYEGTTNQPETVPLPNDGNVEAPAPKHVYLGEVVEVLDEEGNPVLNEQGAPTYEYIGRWEEIGPGLDSATIVTSN